MIGLQSSVLWRLIAGLLVVLAGAASVSAAPLTGTVRLMLEGEALRADEAAQAVVYFRPADALATTPLPEQTMTTRRKQFAPDVMIVTPGTMVHFPNADPILHNAFSSSAGNVFDVGLYGEGEVESVTFDTPGLVRVYCNVHHSMVAHILVVDTPVYTQPDTKGAFTLDVPDTPGTLYIWHPRTEVWNSPLSALGAGPLAVELDVTRRKIPKHLNKFGKSYRSERRRRRSY